MVYEDDLGCAPLQAERGEALVSANESSVGQTDCARCGSFVHDMGVRVGFRGGCLSASRWQSLVRFCEEVGCELIFSVNGALDPLRPAPCMRSLIPCLATHH